MPKRMPRLRLASNWRRLHRTYTFVFGLILVALSAAQGFLPLFQGVIAPQRFAFWSLGLGVLIVVLRYIDQQSVKEDRNHEQK